MRKRTRVLALGAVLLILLGFPGCSGMHLREYPRVQPQTKEIPAQTLVLALPQGADSHIQNMLYLLEAKLIELSHGSLRLETIITEAGELPQKGEWDMALLTNDDLILANGDMGFLAAPFLFPSRESFLIILGSETGPVRSSRPLQTALGGQVIAVYYGGAMGFMCRNRFYDSIGFAGGTMGILEDGVAGAEFYLTMPELEAKSVTAASAAGLMGLIEDEQIKYMEVRRGSPLSEKASGVVRYYEDTGHRFLGLWMAMADGTDPMTADMIKEAVAYTLDSQNQSRLKEEDKAVAALPESFSGGNNEGYPTIRSTARNIYRKDSTRICVSRSVWNQISGLLPQS